MVRSFSARFDDSGKSERRQALCALNLVDAAFETSDLCCTETVVQMLPTFCSLPINSKILDALGFTVPAFYATDESLILPSGWLGIEARIPALHVTDRFSA